jgi:hypothetical protein
MTLTLAAGRLRSATVWLTARTQGCRAWTTAKAWARGDRDGVMTCQRERPSTPTAVMATRAMSARGMLERTARMKSLVTHTSAVSVRRTARAGNALAAISSAPLPYL